MIITRYTLYVINYTLPASMLPTKEEENVREEFDSQKWNNSNKNDCQDPIVSILNLTVDYVMMEPSPLEPDEFKWKLTRHQKMLREKGNASANANANGNGNGTSKANVDRDIFGEETWKEEEDTSEILTPMEQVQVPVVRIFGPIIRGKAMPTTGDNHKHNHNHNCNEKQSQSKSQKFQEQDRNNDSTLEIHQSGCLHIHGAYPYMLARPAQAGPDASSSFYRAYRNASKNKSEQMADANGCDSAFFDGEDAQKIDWDDQESVETIIDHIHYTLEQALRNHLEQNHGQQPATGVPETLPTRFIRQITVVCGRGFYTYCNGATAPFLRIEYYNPSHRWRVKIMLERGFDVPREYIPPNIPQTRGRSGNSAFGASHHTASENDLEVGLLQFRCYEAHIPYTMQFFKVNTMPLILPLGSLNLSYSNNLFYAGSELIRYVVDQSRG